MRKVKKRIILCGIFLVTGVLFVVVKCYYREDTPFFNPIVWLVGEDTQYSEHYSESNFNKVFIGMSKKEVLTLLGMPIKVLEISNGRIIREINYINSKRKINFPDIPKNSDVEETEVIYYYSKAGENFDNWHVRVITFTPDGLVKEVEKTFYAD